MLNVELKNYIFYGAITNKQYTSAIVKDRVPKIQNSSYYEPIVYLNEYALKKFIFQLQLTYNVVSVSRAQYSDWTHMPYKMVPPTNLVYTWHHT